MDIIAKIEKLKSERGWTDYELAQQSMVTQSTIASMKSRNSPPKVDTLQAICNAFGITLAQFFMEDEQTEILSKSEKELISSFRKLPADTVACILKPLVAGRNSKAEMYQRDKDMLRAIVEFKGDEN